MSRPFNARQVRLEEAAIAFRDSPQTSADYMKLLSTTQIVMRQGSGLLWSQVQEVIEEVIG